MGRREELEISSNAIQRILKKYTPERALSEYVWNGFDADADIVKITCTNNDLDEITRIEIEDDGFGIDYEKLNEKFKRFHESQKSSVPKEGHKLKGKNGYGRLTFYKLANDIMWETIYTKNNASFKYEIRITASRLQVFESTSPKQIEGKPGTKVIIDNVIVKKNAIQFINDLERYLIADFSWFLALNPNKRIVINGKNLYISDYIGEHEQWEIQIRDYSFSADYFRWNGKLNEEYSKFYYLNEDGNLSREETTKLNKKGDGFWHTVIIKSAFFNLLDFNDSEDNPLFEDDSIKKTIMGLEEALNEKLREKRRPFLHNKALQFVDRCKEVKTFPSFGNNSWDIARENKLEQLIVEFYEIEPQLFVTLTKKQQFVLLSLFNLMMDSGSRDDLFKILEGLTELNDSERKRFASILEKTKLNYLIELSALVKDRLETIEGLKSLVFKHELAAQERLHLQKFIENHYWIFGEEYQLVCSEEAKFENALRKYNYILHGVDEKEYISHPDKYREMDLFITGTEFRFNHPQNIVVEIKNPTTIKILTNKEYYQIQRYMDVIQSVDQFNNHQEEWIYFLIGQDYDNTVDMNIRDKQTGLAVEQKNYKLFVKKWSQVIADVEKRMHYLAEKIRLKQNEYKEYEDVESLMEDMLSNSAVV